MRKLMPLISIGLAAIGLLLVTGCQPESDEALIRDLLENSQYTAEGSGFQKENDDTTNLKGAQLSPGFFDLETIPFVRFARWIVRPIPRHIEIDINGDSAWATIEAEAHGWFYVLNESVPGAPVYRREFYDSLVRDVYLEKDEDGWHIVSITPVNIWTKDGKNDITIKDLKAVARPSGAEFHITSSDTLLTKDQLPTFEPNDTVKVTVEAQIEMTSTEADSLWAFLHHGRHPRAGHRIHHRDPFYRLTTWTFEREWVIADDSIVTTPALRHAAVDFIAWSTLWGGEDATYYAAAWALPYIVKKSGEETPPDTE
ncbi:hypothetical protein DRP53_02335 [candidate division WOR-3 bacterium]|uniref:Uncharacterized protein n=1 Tax=candidate division WOR-3 bacterium TaxID=2052148 RepID=A0A660SKC4_UNCW3|nr:MAG: hypothetical protein DRP53_02335 [candidate division WOR-3 bacterium]